MQRWEVNIPRSRSVAQVPPRPDRITEREECAARLDRTDGVENKSKSVQRYYNGSIHGGTDQTILISSKHSLITAAAVMSVHVINCLASAGVSCQTRMLAPPCVQNQRFCGGIAHFCWVFWTIKVERIKVFWCLLEKNQKYWLVPVLPDERRLFWRAASLRSGFGFPLGKPTDESAKNKDFKEFKKWGIYSSQILLMINDFISWGLISLKRQMEKACLPGLDLNP